MNQKLNPLGEAFIEFMRSQGITVVDCDDVEEVVVEEEEENDDNTST
jgi:hypothetical protein